MIERFNFYDLYGYLIPGAAWLALLAYPFYLTLPELHLSIAGLTTIGLAGGYVAGHYLAAIARRWLPSYDVVNGKKRYLSETILDDDDQTLAPTLKAECRKHLKERFRLDLSDPQVKKETFFLFRSALALGKMGSYVEQYQGIATMARSLAVGSLLATVFYISWVAGSVLEIPRWSIPWLATPLVAIVLAALLPVIALRILDRRKMVLLRENAEGLVFCLLLIAAGLVGGELHQLSHRQAFDLSLVAAVLSLAYWRFKSASKYFSDIMVAAVYRDFLVLSTARTKGA